MALELGILAWGVASTPPRSRDVALAVLPALWEDARLKLSPAGPPGLAGDVVSHRRCWPHVLTVRLIIANPAPSFCGSADAECVVLLLTKGTHFEQLGPGPLGH